jgi:quinol monooxygenase YgiN
VLVVTRYRVAAAESGAFREQAVAALRVLTARPGCTGATLGRAIDDPGLWTLTTTWQSVGAYRRALSAYDVKLGAVPLLHRAVDEPTAFEPLTTWTPAEGFAEHVPSLAPDAAEAAPGRRSGRARGTGAGGDAGRVTQESPSG